MRYQRIDLNLLIALDVLLSECNVTRAAERLCVTQSSMSGILSRLREYFEDPLLVQVGRQMRLTPLAESLMEPVKDIILRIDSTIAARPDFEPQKAKRHFVIIASDYVSRVLLMGALRSISMLAPGLTFELRATSWQMIQDLEQGQADFLITPAHFTSKDHPQCTLFDDTYQVVVSADNPLCRTGVSFDDFIEAGHVVYQHRKNDNPWFEQWYANQYGSTRRIEVVTHDFSLIPGFVVGTKRIATLQTRLARLFSETVPVRLFAPPMETPRLVEVMQWHKYHDDDPGSAWVRQQIMAAAAAMGPVT